MGDHGSTSKIGVSMAVANSEDDLKMQIINNLIVNLIKNSEDIDPRIIKMVDEHFWELI